MWQYSKNLGRLSVKCHYSFKKQEIYTTKKVALVKDDLHIIFEKILRKVVK